MQTPDGSVLIRAALDTQDVVRGIAEMKTALAELRTYAQKHLSAVRTQTVREGDALTTGMSSLASRLIGALTGGISMGKTSVSGALRSVLTSALGAGGDYRSGFEGIGRNVISGIIAGIRSTASSLWSTLRSIADSMLSTLRGALDIHSPSRVMRDAVGRQIGAGIAVGIGDGQEEVTDAVRALAEAAASSLDTPAAFDDRPTWTIPLAVAAEPMNPTTPAAAAGLPQTVPYTNGEAAAQTPSAAKTAADLIRPAVSGGTEGSVSLIGAAKALLRAIPTTAAVTGSPRPTAAGQEHTEQGHVVEGGSTMNNTFVFNKPVETPARHAKAIRETMEEMLYGV